MVAATQRQKGEDEGMAEVKTFGAALPLLGRRGVPASPGAAVNSPHASACRALTRRAYDPPHMPNAPTRTGHPWKGCTRPA